MWRDLCGLTERFIGDLCCCFLGGLCDLELDEVLELSDSDLDFLLGLLGGEGDRSCLACLLGGVRDRLCRNGDLRLNGLLWGGD